MCREWKNSLRTAEEEITLCFSSQDLEYEGYSVPGAVIDGAMGMGLMQPTKRRVTNRAGRTNITKREVTCPARGRAYNEVSWESATI